MDGHGETPVVLVSNRGPVTFEDDGTVKRGTGGLVTALTGLASLLALIGYLLVRSLAEEEISGRSTK